MSFQIYKRICGYTFGVSFFTNLVTTSIVDENRKVFSKYPFIYSGIVVVDSSINAFLFPAFYYKLITNPKSVILTNIPKVKVTTKNNGKIISEKDMNFDEVFDEFDKVFKKIFKE